MVRRCFFVPLLTGVSSHVIYNRSKHQKLCMLWSKWWKFLLEPLKREVIVRISTISIMGILSGFTLKRVSVCLPVCLSLCLSFRLSICLLACLSLCLSLSRSPSLPLFVFPPLFHALFLNSFSFFPNEGPSNKTILDKFLSHTFLLSYSIHIS